MPRCAWPFCSSLRFQRCPRRADPEQQRLRSCNTEAKAKGLSARERSRFITDCLNGRKSDRPLTPLQARNEA